MSVKQLSDGGSEGVILGKTDDLVGFYGTSTPAAKPTCTLAGALDAGTTTPATIAAAVDEIHAALASLGLIG